MAMFNQKQLHTPSQNAIECCIVRCCQLLLHNLNEMHRCTMRIHRMRAYIVHTSMFPV